MSDLRETADRVQERIDTHKAALRRAIELGTLETILALEEELSTNLHELATLSHFAHAGVKQADRAGWKSQGWRDASPK